MRRYVFLTAAALSLAACSPAPKREAAAQPEAAPPKILMFYPSAPAAVTGQPFTICYGVENADTVRLEPPLVAVSPSPNRCVQVTLNRKTELRLYARAANGVEVSQTIEVPVGAAPARSGGAAGGAAGLISAFSATATRVSPGQQVTICYAADPDAKLTLSPGFGPVQPGKACVTAKPGRTTTYVLSASGPAGTERATVQVAVN